MYSPSEDKRHLNNQVLDVGQWSERDFGVDRTLARQPIVHWRKPEAVKLNIGSEGFAVELQIWAEGDDERVGLSIPVAVENLLENDSTSLSCESLKGRSNDHDGLVTLQCEH